MFVSLFAALLPALQEKPAEAAWDFVLKQAASGRVEVTAAVEEEGKKVSRTWSAAGREEFLKLHPEVAKRHGLDRLFQARTPLEEFEAWLKGLSGGGEDWQKRLLEARKQLEDLRVIPRPLEAAPGRELGIRVERVGETLRDQMGLKEGEGLVVIEVKGDSIAGKGGVKKHDILVVVDGKDVGNRARFRGDVTEALEKPAFEVQVLRGGKRETMKLVTGSVKKEE